MTRFHLTGNIGLFVPSRLPYWLLLGCLACARGAASGHLPADYCPWQVVDIGIPQPLCGLTGAPGRGMAIATDSHLGNCIACHVLPVPGIEASGTIGPPLAGIGARLDTAQIRLRVVDSRKLNPMSIMPGFYRDPRLLHRPAARYAGRTFLSAQQVEDVIAWLVTLK